MCIFAKVNFFQICKLRHLPYTRPRMMRSTNKVTTITASLISKALRTHRAITFPLTAVGYNCVKTASTAGSTRCT